jgi:hypothetical protein
MTQLHIASLDEPDKLFGLSMNWTSLSEPEKAAVVAEAYLMAADQLILPIPSTALIGVAIR